MENDFKKDKNLKTAMVLSKIIIVLFVIAVLTTVIWAVVASKQPKYNYNAEIRLQTIDYRDKTYHYLTKSSLCEFEIDKCVKNGIMKDIYTVKNDPNCDFLYFSEFGNHAIFTSIDDFDEKYPLNEYKKKRVTSVKFCNESNGDWQTDDSNVIDIIVNVNDYSDLSPAAFPLGQSAGFSCSVYLFEDDLAVSQCDYGTLAYYDGKWIFVSSDTNFEGEANANIDTRTYTGIEINNPKAVEKLNSISQENFSYITE